MGGELGVRVGPVGRVGCRPASWVGPAHAVGRGPVVGRLSKEADGVYMETSGPPGLAVRWGLKVAPHMVAGVGLNKVTHVGVYPTVTALGPSPVGGLASILPHRP